MSSLSIAADDAVSTGAAISEVPITEADRSHWAFHPIDRAEVPNVPGIESTHPIDRFIARDLREQNLSLQPNAEPAALMRRMWFDIIGLPPTMDELEAGIGSDAEAWGHLVDDLLSRPEYGERWAQHWLDVARFAETDGFEHDHVREEAWKYRDWVINALNDDVPYDEFIRLQIAGDELRPGDDDALTATRFCLSGPDMPDINSQDERRHTLLNELTSTIGSAILGVQLGCAQCHDHKYDPISQADFYRIRAVFEPAVHVEKNKSISVLREPAKYDEPSYLWVRGDFRRPGPEVAPGVLRVAHSGDYTLAPADTDQKSGRRLAFANWLVSEENPLTARVIVNRVWQHHFSKGLCDTPGDFGYIGSSPSHEELLDWLAAEFMDSGWRLKSLHRLILTSDTWKQRSHLPADAAATDREEWQLVLTADPYNRQLSRYPRRRLEGEVIRDAMLAAAGILNAKRGGPGVMPPLPPELAATLLKKQWTETEDISEHTRRSIYVFARRNLRYPIFDAFDRPDANASCTARNVSTTAPQSLYLLNSQFSHDVSRCLAVLIAEQTESAEEAVRKAFQRVLSRMPDESELQQCRELLNEAGFAEDPAAALTELALVLFNTNEFVYVD